jgi:hypothetical protein
MDYTLVIGLVVVVVVSFFAYQWFTKNHKKTKQPRPVAAPVQPAAVAQPQAPVGPPPPVATQNQEPNQYPQVAGQTQQEMLQKEPLQRSEPPSQQQAVTHGGDGPAFFDSNLRHPEQSFHQPTGLAATPNLKASSDVGAARASASSTPMGGNQQAFTPEMAQNGGALVGTSMFAFDGMEPTDFSSF